MRGIPGEDEYWEHRREEWENPRAFRKCSAWDEDEPVYENGNLFLDGDLLDIVEEQKGIVADSAEWNGNWECIEYRYRVA